MVKLNGSVAGRSWDKDFPIMARAEGIYLYDTDGKRHLGRDLILEK